MNKQLRESWTMPDWMQAYDYLIGGVRPQDVEEYMNDHSSTVFNNAPRAMICVDVKAQVGLLTRLYNRGLLHVEAAAYHRGVRDRQNGKTADDCPFDTERLQVWWCRGWMMHHLFGDCSAEPNLKEIGMCVTEGNSI